MTKPSLPTPPTWAGGWLSLAAVAALTGLAAWVRLPGLDQPGLWLDEILSVFRAQTSPFTTSWTPGTDPQHGPLFHAMLWAVDLLHPGDGGYRLPFAVFGVFTVPLIFLVGRDLAGVPAGILSAALFASAPLHVYLSREARPYGLLVFLQVLMLASVSRQVAGGSSRRWQSAFFVATVLLSFASSQGIWYVLVGLSAWAVSALARPRDAWRGTARGIAMNALTASVLFFALHGYLLIKSPDAVGTPPITADFVARMFNGMVTGLHEHLPVTADGRLAAIAAIAGVVVLAVWRRVAAGVHLAAGIAGVVLPFVLLSIADHGLRVRFMLAGVAPFALLVGSAAGTLIELAAARALGSGGRAIVAATMAACAVAVPVGRYYEPLIREAVSHKPDWRRVALLIKDQAHAGDLVLTTNDWARVNLLFHLPRVGAQVEMVSAEESVAKAEQILSGRPLAFIVSGGYHATADILRWQARYPELMAHRNDAVRVNFYPDLDTALAARPSMREVARHERTLRQQLEGVLVPGLNAAAHLLEGWGDLEEDGRGRAFRWVLGRSARIYVPVAGAPPARLRLVAAPLPGLKVPQRLHVTVNDVPAWSGGVESPDLVIALPTGGWKGGGNFVTLAFDAAARPKDVLPGSADQRELAVQVRRLALEW